MVRRAEALRRAEAASRHEVARRVEVKRRDEVTQRDKVRGGGTGRRREEGGDEKRLPKRCCTHAVRDGWFCGVTTARIRIYMRLLHAATNAVWVVEYGASRIDLASGGVVSGIVW